MRPENLSDDEFCKFADDSDIWIKSAIERIERLSENTTKDDAIDEAYSLIDSAASMLNRALSKIDGIKE